MLNVAPLIGAWIEITYEYCMHYIDMVAPLIGAWIEIYNLYRVTVGIAVAPLIGAWIEIGLSLPGTKKSKSLLS